MSLALVSFAMSSLPLLLLSFVLLYYRFSQVCHQAGATQQMPQSPCYIISTFNSIEAMQGSHRVVHIAVPLQQFYCKVSRLMANNPSAKKLLLPY